MDCPEYKTLNTCYPDLVSCIQQSPADIVTHLKPLGILAPADVSFLDNSSNSTADKARRIVSVSVNQVKSDTQVYFKLLKAMKDSGDWTKATVHRLEETHKSLFEDTDQDPPQKLGSKQVNYHHAKLYILQL